MPSRNAPAAGASGGAAVRKAALHTPDFMRLEGHELVALLTVERDSLVLHTYLLMLTQMHYTSGEFLGGYARLMELMTPPAPERGKRRPGPSYWMVRNAIDRLEELGLVKRSLTNEAQGQLRIHLESRSKKPQNVQPRPAQ